MSMKASTDSSVFFGTLPDIDNCANHEFLRFFSEALLLGIKLAMSDTDGIGLPPYPHACEALSELLEPMPL